MIQLHQMLGVKLGPGNASGMPLRPDFSSRPAYDAIKNMPK